MKTGALLGVTLQGADLGDTETILETINVATANLAAVADNPRTADTIDGDAILKEAVTDKGYHSNDTMLDLAEIRTRSYVAEPDRGRRNWEDQPEAQQPVYGNRRRIKGDRGKALLRQRGELIERSFAHAYESGAMSRTHLKRHANILKRLLVHTGGFNLGLAMSQLIGVGKPRRLQGVIALIFDVLLRVWAEFCSILRRQTPIAAHPSGLAVTRVAA